MDKLKGIVEEIIYNNEENGYTVGIIDITDDIVTFTGVFPGIIQGETVEFEGKWNNHSRYGLQFNVEKYRILSPDSLTGIERFLASGLIKGVGSATAKKIVSHFGKDTLEILQYNPERIREIEGIGEKKSQMIIESYREQIEIKEIMIYLQQYGISPAYGLKIYKKYREETVKIIEKNPYSLAEDILGIGFKLADKIASEMGIEENS